MATERRARGPRTRTAAAAAALLALLGCASAPTDASLEAWQSALAAQQPLSPQERVAQARAELRAERWQRVESIHRRVVETAWRLWQNSSPLRIWSGARRVAKRSWRLRQRGAAEDRALEWLEPGLAQAGAAEAELPALYARLRERECAQLAAERQQAARGELARGRLGEARFWYERAAAFAPQAAATEQLASALREQEQEQAAAAAQPLYGFRSGDAALAAALLAGDYSGALQLGPPSPDTEFAHAAAQLLLDRRESALAQLGALAQRRDALGSTAARWLEQPEVDLDGALARAVHHYRIRRLLGWIGGNALAERGSALSKTGLRAWKDSLTPMNIALSLPARIARGWKPDGREVREAAFQYLDLQPVGERAEQARRWLDYVGWPQPQPQLRGGSLLRAVQSSYEQIGVPPLIVSRRAVYSASVSPSPALASALEGQRAVWLRAYWAGAGGLEEIPGFPLGAREARRLLDELAFGVERQQLRGTLGAQPSLERLQRLDGALERGWVLFAEPWRPAQASLWRALASTVIDGQASSGSVLLERGEDDVVAARTLGDEVRECPRGVLCLDRDGAVRTTVFAFADVDSGGGVGLQSAAGGAGFALELTQDGPEAALFLPLGRWLGIERWLPLEAEFSIGADRFYLGPVLRKQSCSEEADPDEPAVHDLLPFGVSSRCVIHLY